MFFTSKNIDNLITLPTLKVSRQKPNNALCLWTINFTEIKMYRKYEAILLLKVLHDGTNERFDYWKWILLFELSSNLSLFANLSFKASNTLIIFKFNLTWRPWKLVCIHFGKSWLSNRNLNFISLGKSFSKFHCNLLQFV